MMLLSNVYYIFFKTEFFSLHSINVMYNLVFCIHVYIIKTKGPSDNAPCNCQPLAEG